MKKRILCGACLSVLTLLGCNKAETEISGVQKPPESAYAFELVWSAKDPTQAYDARDVKPNNGWAKRTFDFENNRANEEQVICYPGGIKFHLERYVDETGSWFRDLSGWRYGKYLLHAPDVSFESYTQGLSNGYLFLLDRPEISQTQAGLNISIEPKLVVAKAEGYQSEFTNIRRLNGLRYAQDASILRDGRTEPTVRQILSLEPSGSLTTPDWIDPVQVQPEEKMDIEILAPNVYLVKGVADGRNVLALSGKDGWVIFGAPLHPNLSKAVFEALMERAGLIKVHKVFVSHAHGDHTGGIDFYLEKGATLLVSENVAKQLVTLKPESVQAENIQTFSNVDRFNVGGYSVELHEVPNSHAKGLSFVFIPGIGLIYQGDFLSVPRDGTITAAMPVTRELHAYLAEQNIKFSRMIGHHENANITPQVFEAIVEEKADSAFQSMSCETLQGMISLD